MAASITAASAGDASSIASVSVIPMSVISAAVIPVAITPAWSPPPKSKAKGGVKAPCPDIPVPIVPGIGCAIVIIRGGIVGRRRRLVHDRHLAGGILAGGVLPWSILPHDIRRGSRRHRHVLAGLCGSPIGRRGLRRRSGRLRGLGDIPCAINPDPSAAPLYPVPRDPNGTPRGRQVPVCGDPLPLPPLGAPMAGHPHVRGRRCGPDRLIFSRRCRTSGLGRGGQCLCSDD